jgi:N-carbamoylputrescine amidase
LRVDPAAAARFGDGQRHQSAASFRHFAESAIAEIIAQSGSFEFAPADAREVARDQGEQVAAAGQTAQHLLHAGTACVAEVRADAQVIALGGGENFGHGGANELGRGAGPAHHFAEDHGIEHALHGDAVGGGVEAGDAADAFHQGFAVMGPGTAGEGAVDIEENQSAVGQNAIIRRYNGDVQQAKFRVGLIQMACAKDPNQNLTKAEWRIREAAGQGAQIICVQELFRSEYFCREENAANFDLAEPVPGPTSECFGKLAGELGVAIVSSVFERRAAGVYHNTALVTDADGALTGTYRKMHIPDDPLYYEKYYFTPGDLGFRAFDTRFARVEPLVCWDQWYPEAARLAALNGAQIIFYPTAIGWHPAEKQQYGKAQHDAWRTIQRAHAIANGVYVAVVNRVGYEGTAEKGIEFWGGSFVCDPFGEVLAEASHSREETLIVECDPRRIEEARRNWPFLRDRRIDAYGGLLKRVID